MNSPLTTHHIAKTDDLAPAVAGRLGGDPAGPGRRRFMRLAGGGVVVAAAGSSAVLTGC
ncbi:MAG: hypothetical protein RL375_4187, partial [Pseudomonadota bacterium]